MTPATDDLLLTSTLGRIPEDPAVALMDPLEHLPAPM